MDNTEKKPLVSIVIPTYNCSLYIEKCLKSLISQSYRNLEIIVIDDGSVDDTAIKCKRLAKFDPRIRYFYQKNQGVSTARNQGLDLSRGEYICFVDGDDYVEPMFTEKMLSFCLKHNLEVCECGCRVVDLSDNLLNKIKFKTMVCANPQMILRQYLLYENTNDFLCNKIFKAEVIKDKRLKPYKCSEDFEFLVRVYFEIDKKGTIDDLLYNYVRHNKATGMVKFNVGKMDAIYARELVYADFLGKGMNIEANMVALQICSRAMDLFSEASLSSKLTLRKTFKKYAKSALSVDSGIVKKLVRSIRFFGFYLASQSAKH